MQCCPAWLCGAATFAWRCSQLAACAALLLRPVPSVPESCPHPATLHPPSPPAEIKPCTRLLFQLAGGAGSKAATIRDAWAQRMQSVCVRVRHHAAALHKHSRPAEACGVEGQGAPTKRQRTWA